MAEATQAKPEAPLPDPPSAPQADDPGRRELRPGEVYCGICGYPVVVERIVAEDGSVTEVLKPHFGKH